MKGKQLLLTLLLTGVLTAPLAAGADNGVAPASKCAQLQRALRMEDYGWRDGSCRHGADPRRINDGSMTGWMVQCNMV